MSATTATAVATACLMSCLAWSLPATAADAGANRVPARAVAPIDLTGYWVSLVTEDWRFRMLVADPGDTLSIPLNAAGLKIAKAWNPSVDRAHPDEACRAFGAAGVMRLPGRVHIDWQDADTLEVQTDSGTQTRLFHFAARAAAAAAPSWQGDSIASWQGSKPGQPALGSSAAGQREGYLQVVTTDLRPGYLRTNGVPYGAATRLLEYYDTFKEATHDDYLVVTTIVQDLEYLTEPFVTSTHFRKLSGPLGWDPTPCRSDEPR